MSAGTLHRTEDEETRLARARLGKVLRDKWHLDELLGVGGMAAVYAATHRQGKRVAIKVLHAKLAHNAEIEQRFVDEGYIANHVDHAGVVSILDDDVAEDGSAFLVMDLLDGEALDEMLDERGSLDPLELLSLMDDLLDVLGAAHARGIIHRDIKPGNIFVTRDRRIKLLDFGVAQQSVPWRRSHVTPSDSAIGTPAFMAPEQARGRVDEIDARADLWAVGATMFTALAGRQVHEAETYNEEMLAAMTQPAGSLAFVAPHLPGPLIDFVDRSLAYERDARWPSAETMQAALREVHAMLIEQRALGASSSDPQVSLEDGTSGAASQSPVTISNPRNWARRGKWDAETILESRPKSRGARWWAVACALVVMNALGWIRWHHQRLSTPLATNAAPPAAAEGVPRSDRPTERPEATCPVADRMETRALPARSKGPRRGTRAAESEVSSSMPDPLLNRLVDLGPSTTPRDPLERRR